MSNAQFSPLDNLLSIISQSKDRDGYNLVDHMTELFNRILIHSKEFSLDKFEEQSYLLKMTRLKITPPMADTVISSMTKQISFKLQWLDECINLTNKVLMI